tara:strand:- start:317 stop:520 length:204 start_codon:yes stop_codon:yes gene_type:complete
MRVQFQLADLKIEALVDREDRAVGLPASMVEAWIEDEAGNMLEFEALDICTQEAIEEEACSLAGRIT